MVGERLTFSLFFPDRDRLAMPVAAFSVWPVIHWEPPLGQSTSWPRLAHVVSEIAVPATMYSELPRVARIVLWRRGQRILVSRS